VDFELVGSIHDAETIAAGPAVRQRADCVGGTAPAGGGSERASQLYVFKMGRSTALRFTGSRPTVSVGEK
jgi:hypothetical protein